jgi:uncharacterized protein DUF1236
MSSGLLRSCISKTSIFGYLATALVASYALASSGGVRDRQSDGCDVVIAADQKEMFLAYVRRWKISSDLQRESVSVGEVLPDVGVRYYEIPLYYGAPFYRWTLVGGETVIVDPTTRRVIEAIKN